MMVNNLLQFDKCYLDSIKVVVNHEIKEDILLTFGSFWKQMATNLGGEVKISTVNERTPAELPRAVIISKEILLHFGLNRIEIEIKGVRKHANKSTLFDLYKHRLKEVESLLQSYFNKSDFSIGFAGIIAPVRFPQLLEQAKDILVGQIFSLCTGRTNHKLATYSSKIGLREVDKFFNYEISDYEVKNIALKAPPGLRPATLNLDEFPTVERGALVVVDVNNKPQVQKFDFKQDFPNLITSFFHAIDSLEMNLKNY